MRWKVTTMMGISTTTIQAPWLNFVMAMSIITMPAATAPSPFTASFQRQPATRPRRRSQCTTMPDWLMVKPRNTPRA
ncbi:MAG: hypothetical protein BWY56_02310 [Acidobacteria bacterium ADurb.Bin340]|nr:MAG: hypothetical protein BWY56_02310 [Acidobacteria bacterium ADurb.Bin340]